MTTTANYGFVSDPTKLEAFVDKILEAGKPFGFDIESGYTGKGKDGVSLQTYHPDWILVGFSFTNSLNWARYVPVGHDEGPNMDMVPALRALWRLLQSGLGVAHNVSFELNGLARAFRDHLSDDPDYGEAVRESNGFFPFLSDTMTEAFLTQQYAPAQMQGPGVGLKGLTKFVFGHEQVELVSLFPDLKAAGKASQLRFNPLPLTPEVVAYACEDAVWCLALHEKHYPELKDQFIYKIEMALTPVLAQMEFEGLALDWQAYEAVEAEVLAFKDAMNEEIQRELSEKVGEVVNINLGSPKQVAEMLYTRLGMPIKERTATDAPSTSSGALVNLAKEYPVVQRILEWREVGKLASSYITKYLKELRYAEDGRAHPNHKQNGAATGRMAVDHVSYQQWPKPYHYALGTGKTLDLNYRNLLVAPEGYRIVGYDFSQVELRILAGMSNETVMLKAFRDGIDIHSATAAAMFQIPVEDVTKALRAKGKTGNFAVVFQSGAQNMADMMGTTKEEAQELLNRYYAGYPNLRVWMDDQIAAGSSQGFVETKFGRKFTIWEYKSYESWIRAKGDRMCINAPVQGGAADYMKIGMVRVYKALKKAEAEGRIPKGGIRLVMTVHDALEFYVHESVTDQTVVDIISPCVSFPVDGLPEIRADWHAGQKWGTVFEIEFDSNKQIESYEYKVETPYGETFKFTGKTLEAAQADYDEWEKNYAPPVQEQTTPDPAEAVEEHPVLSEATERPADAAPLTPAESWIRLDQQDPKLLARLGFSEVEIFAAVTELYPDVEPAKRDKFTEALIGKVKAGDESSPHVAKVFKWIRDAGDPLVERVGFGEEELVEAVDSIWANSNGPLVLANIISGVRTNLLRGTAGRYTQVVLDIIKRRYDKGPAMALEHLAEPDLNDSQWTTKFVMPKGIFEKEPTAPEPPKQEISNGEKLYASALSVGDSKISLEELATTPEEEPVWWHPFTVTVVLDEMPTRSQYDKFKAWLLDHPGLDTVKVATPGGTLQMDTKHSITPDHEGELSIILGGARVRRDQDDVSGTELVEGVKI